MNAKNIILALDPMAHVEEIKLHGVIWYRIKTKRGTGSNAVSPMTAWIRAHTELF